MYINNKEDYLLVFDMDETLFHNNRDAYGIEVIDKNTKKVVKTLSWADYHYYKLNDNEDFDYSFFRSSDFFIKNTTPIQNMIDKLMDNHEKGYQVIILTARGEMDDMNLFNEYLKSHGITVPVYMVGDTSNQPTHIKKKEKLQELLQTEYSNAGILYVYDDDIMNLAALKSLEHDIVNHVQCYSVPHNHLYKNDRNELCADICYMSEDAIRSALGVYA